jgi:hypothetical protein
MDELDRIAAEAAVMESEAQAKIDDIENPPPLIDPAETWAQIPMMLGALLAIAMPELKDAYTEPACMQWGGAMAQVAEKYDWEAAETMSKWAPELALVFASVPLVLPTIAAIKTRKAQGQRQPEKTIEPELNNDLPVGGGFSEPDA